MENNEVIFDEAALSGIDMQFLEMEREQRRIRDIWTDLYNRVKLVVDAVNNLITVAEISDVVAGVDINSYLNNISTLTYSITSNMATQISSFRDYNQAIEDKLAYLNVLLEQIFDEDTYNIQVKNGPNSESKGSTFNELLRNYIDGQQNGTSNEQETASTPETQVNSTPNVQETPSTSETQVNDESNTEETETVEDWIWELFRLRENENIIKDNVGTNTSEYQDAENDAREKGEEILAKAHEAVLNAENEYGVNSPEAVQAKKNYYAVDAIVNLEVSKQILWDAKSTYYKTVENYGEDSKAASIALKVWNKASWDNNHFKNLATAEAYMKEIFGDDSNMYKYFDYIFSYSKSKEKGLLPS